MTISEAVRPKTAHLERLFRRYPDVPKEVIVKEDMQRDGFRFTEAALRLGEGRRLKTYQLFSWDQASLSEMTAQATMKVPDYILVDGGPYALRRMRMRPRLRTGSAYLVDLSDGELWITSEGERIARIRPYPPEPRYFQKRFPDGTPYYEVVSPEAHCIVFRQCQHWGPEEECKFCDINENARTKKMLGQVASIQPKDPEQVAIVMEEVFRYEEFAPEWQPRYVHINGGSITRTLRGMDEAQFYARYTKAVRERLGTRWPILLQTQPWPTEVERWAQEQGATVRSSNFEVWDPRLFRIVCPGKERVMGRDEWLRRILEQVEIFGEGNVTPGFVAGVEMAQPWGFKTVREAVASTCQGLAFLMAHGVVPRPISWCVEALSALAGQEPPPIEYFIEIDRAWYELWDKYCLPPPRGYLIGPGRNLYQNSAAYDMGPR